VVAPLQEAEVGCPYCGASFTLLLDVSQGPGDYIEDCAICCAPIEIMLRFDDDGEPLLWLRRGDE
jgi:hypothetical protein